jgi:hypothetical protein
LAQITKRPVVLVVFVVELEDKVEFPVVVLVELFEVLFVVLVVVPFVVNIKF